MKHANFQVRSLLRRGALIASLGALVTGCAIDADSADPTAGEAEQALSVTNFTIAMQANAAGNHHLWLVTPTSSADTLQTMASGTSPAVTSRGAHYGYAFQAPTGHLWIGTDLAAATDTGRTMKAGTSPAIAALGSGGYQIAFQGDDGNLWTTGTAGTVAHGLGMAPGTSPSIVGRASDPYGYQVAFQANTNVLWIAGNQNPNVNTALGMKPATSPSITRVGSNFEVAFADSSSFLEVWHSVSGSVTSTGLGLWAGTSPSIAPSGASYSTYDVAFEASSTSHLWTLSGGDTGIAMKAGTSPSYASTFNAVTITELAFQDTSSFLHTLDANGSTNQLLGMDPASSPSTH